MLFVSLFLGTYFSDVFVWSEDEFGLLVQVPWRISRIVTRMGFVDVQMCGRLTRNKAMGIAFGMMAAIYFILLMIWIFNSFLMYNKRGGFWESCVNQVCSCFFVFEGLPFIAPVLVTMELFRIFFVHKRNVHRSIMSNCNRVAVAAVAS